MRTNLFYLMGLIVILSACEKEDIDTVSASLGQEINLKEKQTVQFNASPSESSQVLSVKLDDVNDRRCPGVCITYDGAFVTLKVGSGTESGSTVNMCIGDCNDPYVAIRKVDTAEVSLNGLNYMIRLLEVNPHPNEKNTKPRARMVKEAKLIVERL